MMSCGWHILGVWFVVAPKAKPGKTSGISYSGVFVGKLWQIVI